mmetsp:Transcript_31125/g.74510  ORF Transcript_31125/g.74510 Transcript_31125/m.74510 type:complete len:272 (-) Transcript_31125:1137-1952(-)
MSSWDVVGCVPSSDQRYHEVLKSRTGTAHLHNCGTRHIAEYFAIPLPLGHHDVSLRPLHRDNCLGAERIAHGCRRSTQTLTLVDSRPHQIHFGLKTVPGHYTGVQLWAHRVGVASPAQLAVCMCPWPEAVKLLVHLAQIARPGSRATHGSCSILCDEIELRIRRYAGRMPCIHWASAIGKRHNCGNPVSIGISFFLQDPTVPKACRIWVSYRCAPASPGSPVVHVVLLVRPLPSESLAAAVSEMIAFVGRHRVAPRARAAQSIEAIKPSSI